MTEFTTSNNSGNLIKNSSELTQSLKNRVYFSARDGMPLTLYALLSEKSDREVQELLNQQVVEEDGQRCTPLIIAARHGHEKVVIMLLSKFTPDIEQEGTVKFDGYVIEGASALWCAAGMFMNGWQKVTQQISILYFGLLKRLRGSIGKEPEGLKVGIMDCGCCTMTTLAPSYAPPSLVVRLPQRTTVITLPTLRPSKLKSSLKGRFLLSNDCSKEENSKADVRTIPKSVYKECLQNGKSVGRGAGHLDVVKTLVKSGANVNHPTQTNSTPLRAACFDGRLDIVKYLTDHGADIHIANKYNNTCLMIAAYKGHLDVVSFLLEKGANPDEKAHCGATALHFAAECGHMAIVKELLEYGARITKNENGMSPLIAAAERTRACVVEFLVTRPEISRREKIEALELLGASYANDKDNYCLELAYHYLHRTMEMRYSDPSDIVLKELNKPVAAYENWVECQTVEELEAIQRNQNALHMESLAIRERILGPHNPEVPHPIIFRGAVFADNARFDRCIELWLHALHLRQQNKISVVKDLLRFAQVFSQMIHVGVDLTFSQVEDVLAACVLELERNKEKLANPGPKDDTEQIMEELESNVTTVLYILVIITKLMKFGSKKDEFHVNRLVFRLNQLQLSMRDGQTLLHLCVNAETPVDDFHTNDVCKFPCATTAKLLIQCGADVNAMDQNRNTPLHIIVSYQKPISDFLTLHSIIMELTEAGAHMDTVNMQGETPSQAATTGVAEIILRTQTKLSLKCMAAKAVKTYNLMYRGQVPQSLESFIELHGPGEKQG